MENPISVRIMLQPNNLNKFLLNIFLIETDVIYIRLDPTDSKARMKRFNRTTACFSVDSLEEENLVLICEQNKWPVVERKKFGRKVIRI